MWIELFVTCQAFFSHLPPVWIQYNSFAFTDFHLTWTEWIRVILCNTLLYQLLNTVRSGLCCIHIFICSTLFTLATVNMCICGCQQFQKNEPNHWVRPNTHSIYIYNKIRTTRHLNKALGNLNSSWATCILIIKFLHGNNFKGRWTLCSHFYLNLLNLIYK